MEFPPNSQTPRPRPSDDLKKEVKPEAVRITTSEPIKRKKPLGSRIKDMFVGGDAKSVGLYLAQDVLLPALRDMIADAASKGVEQIIFGEVRSANRRSGPRGPAGRNGYVAYDRFSHQAAARREEPRTMSRRARGAHDFDEIVIETRAEANEAIDQMFILLDKYNWVSVAELYTIVGISPEHTDHNWGWTDLQGISATKVSGGYLLNISRPEPRD